MQTSTGDAARRPHADRASGGPTPLWHSARFRLPLLWRYRVWLIGHARALLASRHSGTTSAHADDFVHLQAAAAWLACAQDASTDGGIVGRYRLKTGWTSSYPETTGYIVPTFIALGPTLGHEYFERAERAVAFLLATQMPDGAFPAHEIGVTPTRPSPFNTAQIIHGLLSWHRHTGNAAALAAARHAGEWLTTVQDNDGAWRRWFYANTASCYSAYLACWLADLGAYCGDDRFLASSSRHLDWVLTHRCAETGWIDRCGFTDEEHRLRVADMHTLAYTFAGMLVTSRILHRDDACDAVITAAGHVADVVQELGWLPGLLDWQWRARNDSATLTGNSQMALVWMSLRDITGDDAWLRPAYRAIDLVKATQLLDSPNPGLQGGIAGASPLWGRYQNGAILSWATKFYIDALLQKADIEGTPWRQTDSHVSFVSV